MATTAALNTVENKIPNINSLVKKKQQIKMQKYQTLRKNILLILIIINLQMKELIIRLIRKYCWKCWYSDLDNKTATLLTKAELRAEHDKTVKLQAFDSD